MYGEFIWWQGVVEDRIDPLKLGRCRVRILGYHTDNKQENDGIPTADLPWAYPSQPITSAAMNGIGTTPMGPVEGTWVFGFFRDGKNAQEPVIMGTFGGIPESGPNPVLGFNDPKGKYPLSTFLFQPDTNQLARGSGLLPVDDLNGENSPSLIRKRETRQTEVAVGVAGDMSTTIPNTDDTGDAALYIEAPWNEPNPRYGGVADSDTTYLDSVTMSSQYPFNHVRMSESGHVEEWDDTPYAERLHKFHTSGTFEEIQPDGTKVIKIVGNEYEITLGYKDVLISGTCNVTIGSDCRMLYLGDLVQEVYGDYHLNVHKDMRTKISGNEAREVLADRKIVINGEDDLNVGKNQIINIADNLTYTVGGNLKETVKKDVLENYGNGLAGNSDPLQGAVDYPRAGNHTTLTYGSSMLTNVTGKYTLTSKQDMKISCTANYNLNVTGTSTIKVTGAVQETFSSTQTTNVTGAVQETFLSTLTTNVTGAVQETFGSLHTSTGSGAYTIVGNPINLNP